jgi:uncharacterized protein YecT (DUF1311 family)
MDKFIGLFIGGLFIFLQQSHAASFDCAKSKSKIEKAICADSSLSNLDEYLGRYYSAASEALKDGAACLKTDQRVWVKTVRDACGTKSSCLKDVYLQRLGTLDNLQPSVSQLKNIDLPRVPSLVTTIPPALDSLPAKPGKAMKVAGKLVYEIDDIYNQGYGVKPEGGKAAAYIFDMDFGSSPTHEIVKELTEQGGNALYEVRGYVSLEGGFDAGQCRFVYAMP